MVYQMPFTSQSHGTKLTNLKWTTLFVINDIELCKVIAQSSKDVTIQRNEENIADIVAI